MSKINHNIFGPIEYDLYWCGEIRITMYDREENILLNIEGDSSGEFNEGQIQVFQSFMNKITELLKQAEIEIYKYYLEVYADVRERVGEESADEFAPHIDKKDDMRTIVKPTAINVCEIQANGSRIIGLLLDCTWDASHGIAVKFENEQVVEIGFQDIVL